MSAHSKDEGLRYRNVTTEAMLRHVRVVTKDNTVQLWFGGTHIVNVEPDSIPAIALQAFAADQPNALLSSSSAERGMVGTLEEMRARDDRNGSLPDWYREQIDAALSARAGEDKQATRGEDAATASTDRL